MKKKFSYALVIFKGHEIHSVALTNEQFKAWDVQKEQP
jgi:hypothetical protein